ncbi:MAG: Hsp20/alpha crystallin family protein [Synechococcaceae cyanobacterium]
MPQPEPAERPAVNGRSFPPSSDAPASEEKVRGPLLSEFRYGTWSRSFRFPVAIEREQLQAVYRDGLLSVTAPKANKVSSVSVKVDG